MDEIVDLEQFKKTIKTKYPDTKNLDTFIGELDSLLKKYNFKMHIISTIEPLAEDIIRTRAKLFFEPL